MRLYVMDHSRRRGSRCAAIVGLMRRYDADIIVPQLMLRSVSRYLTTVAYSFGSRASRRRPSCAAAT